MLQTVLIAIVVPLLISGWITYVSVRRAMLPGTLLEQEVSTTAKLLILFMASLADVAAVLVNVASANPSLGQLILMVIAGVLLNLVIITATLSLVTSILRRL